MKNILAVVGIVPEKIGSYEAFILKLAERAQSKNIKLTFVFPGEPRPDFFKNMLADKRAQILIVPMRKRFDLKAAISLARLIRKEKYDVVHSNFALGNSCCFLAAWFVPIPVYIWHQHNFMGNTLWKKIFMKLLNVVVTKVIVITQAMKRNVVSLGFPESKIEVIYNGIDIVKFKKNPQNDLSGLMREFPIKTAGHVVTAVGDARPEKGQIFLIKAFARVLEDFPESLLLLVGAKKGECCGELEKAVRELNLADKVYLTQMRSDVHSFLAVSDIVIVPSTLEVSLYSIMEAMAAEKPVIASNVGGVPEVVKDNVTGVLVPARDVEALAQAIRNLLKSAQLRETMGINALQTVSREFALERHADQILTFYQTAATDKK